MQDLQNFSFKWSDEKNNILISTRGISFNEIVQALEDEMILEETNNPSSNFKNQKCFMVNINNYVYVVPFVVDINKKEIFLKTAFPSRKATKFYNLK